jgi:endonuclease-3 related protein
MNKGIIAIYEALLDTYGPQGWWPVAGRYHPGDYGVPKHEEDAFEIIAGAVLTQNTAWTSVERALENLRVAGLLEPGHLLAADDKRLKEAVRPAGFFNQKALYLKSIMRFFLDNGKRAFSRSELLKVKGVGNETADSILLYAYRQPEFVVDAYTKRVMSGLGLIDRDASYMELKRFFESNLPKGVALYQEFHALLVEHAKRFYSRRPKGSSPDSVDFLREVL